MAELMKSRDFHKIIFSELKKSEERVLESYGVDGIAGFVKALGFADLGALFESFQVPVLDLLKKRLPD